MDEATALERLQAILARPEFAGMGQSGLRESVWITLRDLVYDAVMRFFTPVVDAVGEGGSGVQLSAIIAWAVALLALVVFGWRALRLTVLPAARASAPSAALRRERSDRLWREAHDLAAAGRLRDAARALYLPALYALDELGLLRGQPGPANREHALSAAQAHPEASGAFAALVERYDRLRYGGYPVEPDTFAELSDLAARARGALPA